MKGTLFIASIILSSFLNSTIQAATHYVAVSSANPSPPYGSWDSAATNIQDAIDVAAGGDLVLVTNGVYSTGEFAVSLLPNRVVVSSGITLQSVNGPEVTIIEGNFEPVRCVYLYPGAILSGFTVSDGTALSGDYGSEDSNGGGIFSPAPGGLVTNCVLANNVAGLGGGAYGGRLSHCRLENNLTLGGGLGGGAANSSLGNCVLSGNASPSYLAGGAFECNLTACVLSNNTSHGGGGAYVCTLTNCLLVGNIGESDGGGGADHSDLYNCALISNSGGNNGGGALDCNLFNCTLTGNWARAGGGAAYGTAANCIIFANDAYTSPNWYLGELTSCCTEPMPSGNGNFTSDPQLADSYHLSANSPCRDAGLSGYTTGVDIDGDPWTSPPAVGCDAYLAGSVFGPLTASIRSSYTNVATGFTVDLTAVITGHAVASTWDFGDGNSLSNRPYASHSWTSPGIYPVVLRAFNNTYPAGINSTAMVTVVEQPVHYVSLASSNPAAPYASWATAARDIQTAVDAAIVPGALVLVSNGIYSTGQRTFGTIPGTNRVVVAQPIMLQSLHGPAVTIIDGAQAARCLYLNTNTLVSGFTLTNGFGFFSGGGAFCQANSSVLSNCILSGNFSGNVGVGNGGGAYGGTLVYCILSNNRVNGLGGGAAWSTLERCQIISNDVSYGPGAEGGGAYGGSLSNCRLIGNSAPSGGGVSSASVVNSLLNANTANVGGGANGGMLVNCTVTGNSATNSGGGAYNSILRNTIVYYNQSMGGTDPNCSISVLDYCCTTPLPTNGIGNITLPPQLADAFHLSSGSPCRGLGTAAFTTGVDLDGQPWITPPSIGCDEFYPDSTSGSLSVSFQTSYTNVAVGFPLEFVAQIDGAASSSFWDFSDGTVVSNQPFVSHAWTTSGTYTVALRAFNQSNPNGISGTGVVFVVSEPIHYVSQSSTQPASPYLNWATAATSIQAAVDAATVPGALVLVSNGVYATGSRLVATQTVRLAITKPIAVRSLNGAATTSIAGNSGTGCVYLNRAGVLSGFTLSHGTAQLGGGIFCEAITASVSNCTIQANSAYQGGGVYSGTLNNCLLSGNWAAKNGAGAYLSILDNCNLAFNTVTNFGDGGGADSCTLNYCALSNNFAFDGGGAYNCALYRCSLAGNSAQLGGAACYGSLRYCTILSNTAQSDGGGTYDASLDNCLVAGNYSGSEGGGTAFGSLNNSTLAGNYASVSGGGTWLGTLNNCIIYYNTSPGLSNWAGGSLNQCCTTPEGTNGVGNIAGPPLFVNTAAGDYRLQTASPCINAANNGYIQGADDLDGNPRIVGGTADIGAYEFQSPGSTLSYAWAQQFGLATDGSADFVDTDGDGANNWEEWRADTIPTNAQSVLRMINAVPVSNGVQVIWQSVPTRRYTLFRAPQLGMATLFQTVATNIAGATNATTWIDNEATNANAYFYRVGVQ